MGCGRSFHRLAAIAKAADVPVDFTHDMQLHPLADMAALGTHEQTVLYQAAKLRALPAYNAGNLILKEKIPIGGILHVRGHSYIFHSLIFLKVLRWRCGWGRPALPSVLLGGEKDVPDVVSGTRFLPGVRRLFRFRASLFSGRWSSSPSFLPSVVFRLPWQLSFPLSSFPLSFPPNVHAVSDILPRGWL